MAVFGPKTGNALPVLDKIFFEMSLKMVKMVCFRREKPPERKKAPSNQGAKQCGFELNNQTIHVRPAKGALG